MRRSTVGIILVLALGWLVASRAAAAQQPGKVHRIGVLGSGSVATGLNSLNGLREGLREVGYVEGRNLTLEVRWAEHRPERLADLAAELVRLPVDLMVTTDGTGARAAQRVTTTLPIVVMNVDNPIAAGLGESLARPGGNITGSFVSQPEMVAKRLELLKEAMPGVTRVAVLLGAFGLTTQAVLAALERTARDLGVELHPVSVDGPDDVERALSAIAHGPAEALVVTATQIPSLTAQLEALVVAKRLPSIGGGRDYAGAGSLMAYGAVSYRTWRRTAVFVDKILKGARPGDLPMERNADVELTIDLKIAQDLGLTMPESLLLRADKVYPVSGVPLPENIRIVPPDRRVAPALAAFAGKWFGTWEGHMEAEHILIVEAIDPPQALVIVAWGNITFGAGTALAGRMLSTWKRERGTFIEGTLQVSYGGYTSSYRLQPDGTLAATATWRNAISRATMTRAQP